MLLRILFIVILYCVASVRSDGCKYKTFNFTSLCDNGPQRDGVYVAQEDFDSGQRTYWFNMCKATPFTIGKGYCDENTAVCQQGYDPQYHMQYFQNVGSLSNVSWAPHPQGWPMGAVVTFSGGEAVSTEVTQTVVTYECDATIHGALVGAACSNGSAAYFTIKTNLACGHLTCGQYNVTQGYINAVCNGTTIDSVCTMSCDTSYEGVPAAVTCTETGWSAAYGCSPKYCEIQNSVGYVYSNCVNKTIGDACSGVCDNGYTGSASEIVCKSSRTFSLPRGCVAKEALAKAEGYTGIQMIVAVTSTFLLAGLAGFGGGMTLNKKKSSSLNKALLETE